MANYIVRNKRTDQWFSGFSYTHSGMQPRGREVVGMSECEARVLDESELDATVEKITGLAKWSEWEVIKLSKGE